MITMVLVTSIAALSTVAALTVSGRSLHQGELGRRSSRARAAADAGASRALSELTADAAYSTHAGAVVMDRAWVLSAAATAPLESAANGQFSWVVPTTEQIVFGIGFIPSRAAPTEIDVVRVTYDRVNASGFGAIAAASSLDIGGHAEILGLTGNAHTNGDMDVSGSASVSGNATATGGYTQGASATVSGTGGGGYPVLLIPDVAPRSYRSLTNQDLCPDGTVRATSAGDPCTGAIIGSGLLGNWNGWSFTGTTWRVNSGSPGDAAVYVYQSSVSISGNPGSVADPWLVTVVVEGLVAGILTKGDVSITGGGTMRPYTSGVGFVAHRDFSSTGGASYEGLIMADEQVSFSGSGTLHGQVIASGVTDTLGSPVNENSVGGSFELTAESTAPQVTGGVQPTDWREI